MTNLSGCGTLPWIDKHQTAAQLPQRVKPVEALAECTLAPDLPTQLTTYSAVEAFRAILENKKQVDARFAECREKHKALKQYIMTE